MWVVKFDARENAESHWLHLCGFSPVCINMCTLKSTARTDAKLHWLHLLGFAPMWVFTCVLKLLALFDQLNIDLLNYTLKMRQMTTAIWRWYNRGLQATFVLMDPSKEVEEGAAFVSPEKDRWEIWPVMIPENVKSLRRVIVFNSSGLGLCVKNYSQFTLWPFHGFFVLARSASEHCGKGPFLAVV